MLGEGEPPVCAPEVQELVDGYLLMRATGRPPWEAGLRLGRSRFWQATRVLARIFEQAALLRLRPGSGCPLLGGGDL